MNPDIKVVDNFLSEESFNKLMEMVSSDHFPWYYCDHSVMLNDKCPQFTHLSYGEDEPKSNTWQGCYAAIAALDPLAVFRVKFNCTPRTPEIVEKPIHWDWFDQRMQRHKTHQSLKACVLYLNTCDGYTYFETGEKVESVANRAVIFPVSLGHAGTSTTNADVRLIMNINFFSA
jgi:hypothetical protein